MDVSGSFRTGVMRGKGNQIGRENFFLVGAFRYRPRRDINPDPDVGIGVEITYADNAVGPFDKFEPEELKEDKNPERRQNVWNHVRWKRSREP